MIGVSVEARARRARSRSAPTRPSIMSLGATTSAPACGLRDRGAGEQLERRVVVDPTSPPVAQDPAVAVVGVLAQAHVGDHEQVGVRGLDRARRELDDALVVPGARAHLVLGRREAEEQHGRDPELRRRTGLLDRVVDREVVDARHRGDRRAPFAPRDDEHRRDEVRRRRARSRAPGRGEGRCCAGGAGGCGEGHAARRNSAWLRRSGAERCARAARTRPSAPRGAPAGRPASRR